MALPETCPRCGAGLARGAITGQSVYLNWVAEGRSPGPLAVGKEHLATGSATRPPMLGAARCAACGLGVFEAATGTSGGEPAPPFAASLVDLEERFWRAAGNPDFYREHLADDGVMAFPMGLMTKPEVVASVAGPGGWERFTMDDLVVVEVAPGVAALAYTTVARWAGGDDDYRAAITSVYALRDGRWSLVLHQQTPLTG